MDRKRFMEILTDPKAKAETTRFSWVDYLEALKSRAEPFTVRDLFDEINTDRAKPIKKQYISQHLRGWVETKDLVVAPDGGVNFYLHSSQLEE